MIKSIKCISLNKAKDLTPNENLAIISITDPGTDNYFIDNFKKNLKLQFDDATYKINFRTVLFNVDQAKEII